MLRKLNEYNFSLEGDGQDVLVVVKGDGLNIQVRHEDPNKAIARAYDVLLSEETSP
jgi:hypothetical protein